MDVTLMTREAGQFIKWKAAKQLRNHKDWGLHRVLQEEQIQQNLKLQNHKDWGLHNVLWVEKKEQNLKPHLL